MAGPWVLGMMSGTSLDGVDAALLRTDGEAAGEAGRTAYRPYSPPEREVLRAALGRWPGEAGVAHAARIVEDAHAEVAAGFPEAELVAFHGQTLAHDPGGRGTHQAGSGERLAARIGRPVAWDFRSADVAAGGEGACLAGGDDEPADDLPQRGECFRDQRGTGGAAGLPSRRGGLQETKYPVIFGAGEFGMLDVVAIRLVHG